MTGHLNGMGGSLTVKLVTAAGVASDKRKRRNGGDDDGGIINIVGGGFSTGGNAKDLWWNAYQQR